MNPQAGMFVDDTPRHHHLEFTLRDGIDPADLGPVVAELPDVVDSQVNLVLGFSGELWAALAPDRAPSPVPFPAIDGVPHTPADIWVWLHGDEAGDMFDAVRAVAVHLAPYAAVTAEVDGWIYHDKRDLTGFVDGTENPEPDEQPDVALLPAGEPGAGGSYVITQRWEHDLDAFAALEQAEQEGVIGRTRPDSIELGDDVRPETSHISRVVIEENGEELEIYRRSVPYGGAMTAGLHFVAFSARPDIFPRMLERMFGADGVHDRLTAFSTPVTGNHWFVPDLDDLAALGRGMSDGGDPACWLDEFGDWIDDPAALLAAAVADALDTDVTRTAPVTGGDVASAHRLDLADGRRVFAKTHAGPPPGFFTTEAAGLAWLREPGVVRVPEVLAVSDGENNHPPYLVLEWVDVGGRAGDDEAFGRSLAALHRTELPSFGREDRRTTGSRGLPNEPCEDWATFYASQRMAVLARLARDGRALSDGAIADLERLADPDRLRSFGGADEPPARLHGDLWAGNRVADTDGSSWLIDPAAHGGHREFDLAMMDLFGGFGEAAFAAYRDETPLADGWRDRVLLHQIAPLVVHAVKFGGSYSPAAERAIAPYSR